LISRNEKLVLTGPVPLYTSSSQERTSYCPKWEGEEDRENKSESKGVEPNMIGLMSTLMDLEAIPAADITSGQMRGLSMGIAFSESITYDELVQG